MNGLKFYHGWSASRVASPFRVFLSGLLVLATMSCGEVVDVAGDVPGIPSDTNFSAPEGIAVWNDKVFVANANFAYQGSQLVYGTGFVTVIDMDTAAVDTVIPIPYTNPQEVLVSGDTVWVLCSGETVWNAEDSTVVSRTSGGLLGIDPYNDDAVSGPSTRIPLPTPEFSLVGYPSGMVIADDEAWIASGTTAALFVVDLVSGEVVRGATDPVLLSDATVQNTTVVGTGPDGLLTVGLFNDDKVFLFDPGSMEIADDPWASAEIGQKGLIDGVLDIESDDSRTYVLLGLANQVVDFDRMAGPAAGVRKLASNLLSPNRMKLLDSKLYVVNSGDNSLAVIDTATGERTGFGLPVNCNPWDLALSERGGSVKAWVTCLKSGGVVVVDTGDGAMVEVE